MYLALSAIFIGIMTVCCIFFTKNKNFLSKSLIRLQVWAIAVIVLYNLSILNISLKAAYIINSIYYAGIHVLVIFMLEFIFALTETDCSDKKKKIWAVFEKLWTVFLAADVISLLLNPFFQHEFELKEFESLCWPADYKKPFYIHLGLCYVLCALSFVLLIRKSLLTNKFYRAKYLSILVLFTAILAINVVFLKSKTELDFSILLYSIFSLLSSYFTFYSTPKKIQSAMLRQISENLGIGIFCFNLERQCIYSNKMANDYFTSRTIRSKEIQSLIAMRNSKIHRQIQIEKNGRIRTLSEDFDYFKDAQGRLFGYILKFTDITDEEKTKAEAQYLSSHDKLTGLLNREHFYIQAKKILQTNPDTKRCILCTDIKNFKLINDIYGSQTGDNLLTAFTDAIKEINGPSSLLGRINGDRFAILVKKNEFNPADYSAKIEELQSFNPDINCKLTVFIGVYEISDPYEKVSAMYDKAFLASQTLKENYSSKIAYYDKKFMSSLIKKKEVLDSFKTAIDEEQFKLFLQPQVCCHSERILGAEALVRWEHPKKGLLNPTGFINILEQNGKIYQLDQFVWEKACQTLKKWQEQNLDLYIAVNVSANDFYYLDIYREFTDLVKKYKIQPQRLKIEITETVFIMDNAYSRSDSYTNKRILKKLQQSGFNIEMDDFGSGYSSLHVLKYMEPDVLKIDMAFLSQTEHKERSKKILLSIVKMAKQLGIKIVVEGVEDLSQAAFLREFGCDCFQGFLYSKPLCVEDFENRFVAPVIYGGKK